jgi:hypothetical protein
MKVLREIVAEQMVEIHQISPELAAYHVRQMPPNEVKQRFLTYIRPRLAGAELSAAGPHPRAGNESSTRFSRPATMTAGARHSTLFPEVANSLPDSEIENRESSGRLDLSPSGERLDHPHGVDVAVASRV